MPAIRIQEHWVNTDHGRLYAKQWSFEGRDQGEGSPIVLFHDSLGCVELCRDFPEHLALETGRSVIAYDRMGFGRSDPNPNKLTHRFVHDEARVGFGFLREALALDRFVAFGHSVGGGMAVVCAAVYPTACRALVTESAQAFVEELTLQSIRAAGEAFSEPGRLQRLEKYHGDKAAWVLHAWVDSWLAPEFRGWRLDDELRALRCPVLALHGDGDEYGSSRQPQRIIELAPGPSTLCLLEACGHVPHREKEALVLERIATWLGALSSV